MFKKTFKHLSVFFIVALWIAPTLGLLISSFRDKESLSSSGWWTAFFSSEQQIIVRTASPAQQILENGRYVIRGNFLENEERKVNRIIRFGTKISKPDEFELAGDQQVIDIKNTRFVLKENGDYEWSSSEKIKGKRGRRIYLLAEIPPHFTLSNYVEVITTSGIGNAFLNSFTVTLPATFIPILIAAFAAYSLSWLQFPGKSLILSCVIALLVVPLQMSLIPILSFYNDIGKIFNVAAKSYPGIWLAHTGFGLPLAIYLLHNYISSLPRDLIESARIDGADHLKIFTRIVLPLSVPALASFAIFQFLWVWNDLLVALVFLSKLDHHIVLTSRLRELLGSRGGNWEILTTSAFITIIVPLMVFLSLQRYFVRGLLTGSVK